MADSPERRGKYIPLLNRNKEKPIRSWKINLAFTSISVLLATTSFGMVAPFFALLINSVGITENVEYWSGVVYSLSYLTGTIFSPIWGSLADRYGRKIMMIRACFGSCAVYFLIAFCVNIWQIVILQLIVGILSGYVSACTVFIATDAPEKKLPFSLSFLNAASACGFVLGPIIGGFLMQIIPIDELFIVASAVLAVATALNLIGVKEDRSTLVDKTSNILSDIKFCFDNEKLRSVVLLILILEIALCMAQPVLTLFVGQLKGEINEYLGSGVVFSLVGFATIITSTFWGLTGSRIGIKKTILVELAGAILLTIIHTIISTRFQLIAARLIYGIFVAGLIPNLNSLIAYLSPTGFRARAFGIVGSVMELGGFLGPILGGFIGGSIGIRWVFAATAAMLSVTLIYTKRQI